MAISKHSAVWDWLQDCPYICDLFFNLSQADNGDTQLIPSESVVREFNDGSKECAYEVALTRFKTGSFEPNDIANINAVVDFDRVASWIEECFDNGNIPVFPDGYEVTDIEVLPSKSGFMVAHNANMAKYMIQFRIEYLKRKEVTINA